MKNILLVILFCLCAMSSLAQVRTYQISLIDSNARLLYIGISNKIRVEGLPANCKLEITGGYIVKWKGQNYYYVHIDSPGKSTLNIWQRSRLIFSQEFENVKLEDLKKKFGSLIEGSFNYKHPVTIDEILSPPEFVTFFSSSFLKPFLITEFNLTFLWPAKDKVSTYAVTGSKIPTELQDIIRILNKGDRIFLDDIKCLGPDGGIRFLNPMHMIIK